MEPQDIENVQGQVIDAHTFRMFLEDSKNKAFSASLRINSSENFFKHVLKNTRNTIVTQ